MNDGRATSAAIRWTQRFVLGAIGEDLPRARRISCLVLLAIFVPLGVLSSLAVRTGDFAAPASLGGIAVTLVILWMAATTRTEAQQDRWWWVVTLIGVDQALGILQLGRDGIVLLPETCMLGIWCALYMPTRVVRHAVVCISLAILTVLVHAPDPLVALLAIVVAQITIVSITLLTHSGVLTLRATNDELDDARRLAQVLATTDPLTGAANRRSFTDLVNKRAAVPNLAHAVLLVDVDHFKALNDEHGHLVGDDVLREIARRLTGALPDATVARWGGEEFVVLGPGPTVISGVADHAEALRAAVAGELVSTGSGPVSCTISIGTTRWTTDEPFEDALRRADKALYEAKAHGRNGWATCEADSVAADDVRRPA